ncbi:MAG TPA: hypothetical protein VJ954_00890 [Ignavibacteriaceae bacterium]|nr:hypothetical protein [Ignavibacteriaceae bacterium]
METGYTVSFEADKDILSIKNSGRLNFQKASQYSTEATKLAHQNNCNKYLIDHSDTMLEHGLYKLHTDGAALESFGFKSTDRVAIILSSSSERELLNDKAINAAKWCSTKYFALSKEAEEWLTKIIIPDENE